MLALAHAIAGAGAAVGEVGGAGDEPAVGYLIALRVIAAEGAALADGLLDRARASHVRVQAAVLARAVGPASAVVGHTRARALEVGARCAAARALAGGRIIADWRRGVAVGTVAGEQAAVAAGAAQAPVAVGARAVFVAGACTAILGVGHARAAVAMGVRVAVGVAAAAVGAGRGLLVGRAAAIHGGVRAAIARFHVGRARGVVLHVINDLAAELRAGDLSPRALTAGRVLAHSRPRGVAAVRGLEAAGPAHAAQARVAVGARALGVVRTARTVLE